MHVRFRSQAPPARLPLQPTSLKLPLRAHALVRPCGGALPMLLCRNYGASSALWCSLIWPKGGNRRREILLKDPASSAEPPGEARPQQVDTLPASVHRHVHMCISVSSTDLTTTSPSSRQTINWARLTMTAEQSCRSGRRRRQSKPQISGRTGECIS
jgi:hypothetical protein